MTHKFNEKNMKKLDNPRRRKILPPYETLLKVGLKEGNIMADIGCGIGYFSIPASKIVGENGKVYALDISDQMINEINLKINENKISNIIPIITLENDLKVDDGIIDFAFVCTVLHEANDIDKFISQIFKKIIPGGKIVIVEWEKSNRDFGPSFDHCLDTDKVSNTLDKHNFNSIKTVNIGKHFYAVNAIK